MDTGRFFNSFLMMIYVFLSMTFLGIGVLDGKDYRGLNTVILVLLVLRFLWAVIVDEELDIKFLAFYFVLIFSAPGWMIVLLRGFWRIKCCLGISWTFRFPVL